MTTKKGGRPATGSTTRTSRGKLFARVTLAPAVRQVARETIADTVRVRVAELTAEELNTDEMRGQFRPLLVALVREELTAALLPETAKRSPP